jgi:DNA-binding PadR family transcriptional regulator
MKNQSNNNPSRLLCRKSIIEGILLPFLLKIINDNGKEPLCVQQLASIIQEKTNKKNPTGETVFEGLNVNNGLLHTVLERLERDGIICGIYQTSEEPKVNPKAPIYWRITPKGKEELNDIIEDYRHPFMETLYNLTQISKELFG